MADLRISGLPPDTVVTGSYEFPVNATATPGVSGTTRRVTALMFRSYTSIYIGVPRALTSNFTIETGYVAVFQPRLTLASTQRSTIEGTGELVMSDDFGTRSRLVLAGRG